MRVEIYVERKGNKTYTRDLDQLINLRFPDEHLELNSINKFNEKGNETYTRELDQLINLRFSDEYLELNCINKFSINPLSSSSSSSSSITIFLRYIV